MEGQQPSMMDLIMESHVGLLRQGPGSPEMTAKALSFIDDIDKMEKVADLGCGCGGQTLLLAQQIKGEIIGLDMLSDFIDILNENAKNENLADRVVGVVGEMEALPFQKEEFDLIWSEGAIDAIGFEKGIVHWKGFLKQNGYIAVTCPSWFTDQRPAEVEKLWADAGSGLDSVAHNVEVMQKSGYAFVAAFALPEECWTEHYFVPREETIKALAEKYPGNKGVEDYIAENQYEVQLFSKYKQLYGYAFYIGKKI